MVIRSRLTVISLVVFAALAPRAFAIDLPELIAKVEPSVVRIEVKTADGFSIGSGFLTEKGVVTNYHVIEGATTANVVFADKSEFEVRGVLAADSGTDLAVLRVDGIDDRPSLEIADANPSKGESVAAFGAPKGFSFTTSDGIVSGIRSGQEIRDSITDYEYSSSATWVQTTAAISPGNSGGPLVNSNAQVIGINSWTYKGGQNLNFAISSKDIRSVLGACDLSAVSPFPTVKSQVQEPGDDLHRLQRRIYTKLVLKDFDEKLSAAKSSFKAAVERLTNLYRTTRTTEQTVQLAEAECQKAQAAIALLRNYEHPTPNLYEKPEGLFGTPGEWYVLQVVDEESALVRPSRRSDELFHLSGCSTRHLADGVNYSFDGIWFLAGDTYRYQTSLGTNTVYRLRAFVDSEQDLQQHFREATAGPAVDEALRELAMPSPPSGAELATLKRKWSQWEVRQERIARDARRSASERRAGPKVERAAAMLDRHEELAKKWLLEVVDEEPEAPSANRARILLGQEPIALFRTWRSGSHSAEAKFVREADGSVTLEKPDGTRLSLPIRRLCDADKAYVSCISEK